MEWIPVKDELPLEKQKDYLVIINYVTGDEQMVVEWWFNGVDEWQWIPCINVNVRYEITHWMELPSLPKQ